jgi:protein-S-isoprenylcysteine O-methyltransferase Ste14
VLGSRASPKVTRRAYTGLAQLLVVLAVVLFVAAGTLDYWQGWLFLAAFGVPATLVTIYFLRNDPALIERRLDAGAAAETRKSQKIIQALASVFFVALLLIPALDRRFGWSAVPTPIVVIADLLVALGLLIVFFVFRENSYTSATITVSEGQKVISTGPYRVVRHPMYAGALLMLLCVPLALGSLVGLVAFVPMTAAIVWRLMDEERYLATELSGYEDYRRKVRHRLVPYVW